MVINKKVLILDDDLPFLTLLREALMKNGLRDLDWVTNKDEAERYIADLFPRKFGRMPDLLFVDLKMAEMGGGELMSWLKVHPVHRRIPFIVFADSTDSEEVQKSQALGATAFYPKSDQPEVLGEIVKSGLEDWFRDIS